MAGPIRQVAEKIGLVKPLPDDVKKAKDLIEKRRSIGRGMDPEEMTPAAQEALHELLKAPRFEPPSDTWSQAEEALKNKQRLNPKQVK